MASAAKCQPFLTRSDMDAAPGLPGRPSHWPADPPLGGSARETRETGTSLTIRGGRAGGEVEAHNR